MGGKKKPTLSQLVKRMEREQQQKAAAAKPKVKIEEKAVGKVSVIDPKLLSDVEKEVVRWDYATPYLVATRFNIKLSTATHILRQLASKGVLVLVSKGHRTEVYTTPEKAKKLGLISAA